MFCETLFGLSVFRGISIFIIVALVWIMAAKESPLAGDVTRITYTPAQMYAMRRTHVTVNLDSLAEAGILRYRGSHGRRRRERAQNKLHYERYSNNTVTCMNSFNASNRNIEVITGHRPPNNKLKREYGPNAENLIAVERVTPPENMAELAGVVRGNGAMNYPPNLYVFNAQAISKPHAIDQLDLDIKNHSTDVAIISESHLKKSIRTLSSL